MSDLLEEFRVGRNTGGVPCWYQRAELTNEQREKLDAALAEKSISNPMIAKVLADWGVKNAGTGSVRNHRAGGCTCD